MTASNYYLNFFQWLKKPKRLFLTEIRPKHLDIEFSEDIDYLLYKHSANLAGKLSTINNTVASKGKYLISESPIKDLSSKIELFTGGMLLKDVGSEIIETNEILLNNMNVEFFRNFMNRKLDHYMEEGGFIQNGRFYWKPELVKRLDNKFNIKQGVYARTQIFLDQTAYILADYQTHYYSKLTIWDVIKEILNKNGITDWRDADPKLFKFLIRKTVESKYRIWKGFWLFESVRIAYLDLNHNIKDTQVGEKGISILEYHKKAGRNIEEEDQPVLYVRQGKHLLSHVPSLLRETPSMENLKRYNPRASKTAAKISRKDPFSRYFEIEQNLEHLLDKKIIEKPKPIAVDTFYPQITMATDFIEINQDQDFIRYFSKGKLAKDPSWKNTHIFYDNRERGELTELLQELKNITRKFKLKLSWKEHPFDSKLKLIGEAHLRDFGNFILEQSNDLGKEDLVIWAIDKHNENFYSKLKYNLTVQKDISTQQLLIKSIRNALSNDTLKNGYINPLFPQLVAKMGGFPYLFQAGITMSNTIFIGLDRFRDPNKEKPSITAAAASFSDHGEYLGASSARFDALPTDDFLDLDNIITTLLDDLVKRKIDFSRVIVLRDGRIHNLDDEMNAVFNALDKFSVKGIFITANKSSSTRIFKGESLDDIEELPEQYISVYDYYEPNSFIIASTQPIISHGSPIGTARPMLYRIERHNIPENLNQIKIDISRAIVAFTRLNWASFKGNRLPAPLTFAHNLAGMCSILESKWPIDLKRPTYL